MISTRSHLKGIYMNADWDSRYSQWNDDGGNRVMARVVVGGSSPISDNL